jgi:hypothetical protein
VVAEARTRRPVAPGVDNAGAVGERAAERTRYHVVEVEALAA